MTVWRIYKRNICLPLLAISANCLFTEFFVFSASSGAYLLARQQSIRINLCLLNPNSIHLAIYMQEWKGVFMDMLSCQKKDQNQIGKNIFFLKNLPFTKHSDFGKTFPHLQWWWDLNHFRQGQQTSKNAIFHYLIHVPSYCLSIKYQSFYRYVNKDILQRM